jgi:hypothetical protein
LSISGVCSGTNGVHLNAMQKRCKDMSEVEVKADSKANAEFGRASIPHRRSD